MTDVNQPGGAAGKAVRMSASTWPALVQIVFVFLAMFGLAVAPPVSGNILLVPLGADARAALPRLAVNADAALVAAGPTAGSMIVFGDRDRMFYTMVSHGILMLSAFGVGCSNATAKVAA